MSEKKIRLFLSHASEDKDDFVRPLRDRLVKEEFDVWYDEDSLIVGQSLLKQISKGLKSSDYGIVVLSSHFFRKKWPQEELDGLHTLETAEHKIIIPIWHNVTETDVKEYSPMLASRFASVSAQGIDEVVAQIKKAIAFAQREKEVTEAADPLRAKFATINQTAALNQKFQQLGGTEEGADLVRKEISNLFSMLETKISQLRGALPLPITRDRVQPESYFMVYGPEYRLAPSGTRMTLVLRFDIRRIYRNSVLEATLEERHYFETTDASTDRYSGMGLITERSYSPFFIEANQVVWIDEFRATLSSEYIVTQALSGFGNFVQTVQEGRGITWSFVDAPGYTPPT